MVGSSNIFKDPKDQIQAEMANQQKLMMTLSGKGMMTMAMMSTTGLVCGEMQEASEVARASSFNELVDQLIEQQMNKSAHLLVLHTYKESSGIFTAHGLWISIQNLKKVHKDLPWKVSAED